MEKRIGNYVRNLEHRSMGLIVEYNGRFSEYTVLYFTGELSHYPHRVKPVDVMSLYTGAVEDLGPSDIKLPNMCLWWFV